MRYETIQEITQRHSCDVEWNLTSFMSSFQLQRSWIMSQSQQRLTYGELIFAKPAVSLCWRTFSRYQSLHCGDLKKNKDAGGRFSGRSGLEKKLVQPVLVCPEIYQTETLITETEKSVCRSRLCRHAFCYHSVRSCQSKPTSTVSTFRAQSAFVCLSVDPGPPTRLPLTPPSSICHSNSQTIFLRGILSHSHFYS